MNRTRRQFLYEAGAAAGALGLSGSAHRAMAATSPEALATLAATARANGLLAGSAVDIRALRTNPAYAELIRTQCSIVVAENAMKFGPIHPAPDGFFFDDADFLVNFAERNHILVRGHNFVWHRQLPHWFDEYATPANAEHLLVEHIERVGGRYAGRIHSWDVCNEVIHLEDGQPAGLRNAPWYKLLGPGYIDLAFRTARRVDPKALLCYNDYDIESEAPAHGAKRAAILAMLRGMKKRGVPIDGMGIQGHISAGPEQHYGPGLTQFMADVQALGLKLLVTEMDVNDRKLPQANDLRDREVAATYERFLGTVLHNRDVIAVLTWGLTDKYTWLNGEDSRPDHLPERCLPFDAEMQPVPAFYSALRALGQAPGRPISSGVR